MTSNFKDTVIILVIATVILLGALLIYSESKVREYDSFIKETDEWIERYEDGRR